MRTAPPVQLHIRRYGAWLCVRALLNGLAAGVLAAWLLARTGETPALLAFATALVAVAAATWHWSHVDTGMLVWDGQQWRFRGQRGELAMTMDLGPWMMLRFHARTTARIMWLAASERSAGADWPALRCAVYCRRLDRADS